MCQKQKHSIVSPSEFTKFARLANWDEYKKYTPDESKYYQLGKGMPKLSHGMNKIIDRSLLPFLITDFDITGTAGLFALPEDVEFIDTVIVGSKQADWKPKNLIQSYLDSTIDVPTVDYPIYTDTEDGLQVYPTSSTAMKLTYLKAPVEVNWGYTLVSGRPVYDVATSVNFEWSEGHKISLVAKICGYIGLSIRDGELKQMAMVEEQKAN